MNEDMEKMLQEAPAPTLTLEPFAEEKEEPAVVEKEEAVQPVPPQTRICRWSVPMVRPQLFSAIFLLLCSRKRSAFSALCMMACKSWVDRIFMIFIFSRRNRLVVALLLSVFVHFALLQLFPFPIPFGIWL